MTKISVSSRKENASQPDQDAVPANKKSQKLPSIGETKKIEDCAFSSERLIL